MGRSNSKHLPPKTTDEFYGSQAQIIENLGWLSNKDQEHGVIVTLDKGFFKIRQHIVSIGSLNSDITDTKILLNRVIEDKATRFVFAHNHSNGMAVFSEADFKFTIALLFVSMLIDLKFVDHILFTYERKPISMRNLHPHLWEYDWNGIFAKAVNKYLPKRKF